MRSIRILGAILLMTALAASAVPAAAAVVGAGTSCCADCVVPTP